MGGKLSQKRTHSIASMGGMQCRRCCPSKHHITSMAKEQDVRHAMMQTSISPVTPPVPPIRIRFRSI
eukprot:2136067-Rhodomonas_salina.1